MTSRTHKSIKRVLHRREGHWVGDGFPVTSVFSPRDVGDALSPFIMFDYAAPTEFPPSKEPRGVDTHPHRGFETVTIVYQGELQHRDSAGNKGKLLPGGVQWMTAASGVLHEEKHSDEFTRNGGTLEMAQIWVNLPAREKMSPPRYQELSAEDIPIASLPRGAGSVRVIAGDFAGTKAATRTATPVILWDAELAGGKRAGFPIPAGHNAGVLVRRGSVSVGGRELSQGDFALLEPEGEELTVETSGPASLLVLAGEPLNEPVAAYGPFVMNTKEEIEQAIGDLREGRFGEL